MALPDAPLPKYRYPSAGNLYPVQTYVLVRPDRVEGARAGVYYYHPKLHRLVRVADEDVLDGTFESAVEHPDAGLSAFTVFLVARMSAITPMYGRLASDFCLLEAGYMGQLLRTAAPASRLGLRQLQAVDFELLQPLFNLEEDQVLLTSFLAGRVSGEAGEAAAAEPRSGRRAGGPSAWRQMAGADPWRPGGSSLRAELTGEIERLEFKLREAGLRSDPGQGYVQLAKPTQDEAFLADLNFRRSDRELLRAPVELEALRQLLAALAVGDRLLQIYLHVKEGGVRGLGAGTYRYDAGRRDLVELTAGAVIPGGVHTSTNRPVFEAAGFSLFLVGRAGRLVECEGEWARDAGLLEAGALGQLLMTLAPALEVGVCPLGAMDFDPVRHLFKLDDYQVLLHHFVGGRISPRRRARPAAPAQAAATSAAGAMEPGERLAELRAYLGAKLPEYMIPATFMVLGSLPLTANGKVDRGALPAPDRGEPAAANFVSPRNPVERRFADLWGDLLGLERVGALDNFFALGGDSVQGIQFLARAKQAGYELSVREFFELQTIEAIALAARPVDSGSEPEPPAGAVAAEPAGMSLSDFPDAELTQEELEQLIAEFDLAEGGELDEQSY